ncbi:uncharacterized protein [Fopius arisanus]|uniref:Uncharacterized protein n=1 Tax=Fopius arisanus TaxID=64838 RepID=A0A9R1TGD1_9HYME|nr:PREDICTED: uncharacterized protein LOC105269956 [Fopius arisanus]
MFGVKDKVAYRNGRNFGERNEKIETSFIRDFWRKININEWTFSLFLLGLSLTIVAVKLVVMYGFLLPTKTYVLVKNPSQYLLGLVPGFDRGEDLGNHMRENKDGFFESLGELIGKFGWLVKAAVSGISLMGFTWFIVYKDSRIPGVNPPSPFSPGKRKFQDDPRIQMNYLIGVINGLLIFIYMCF